MVAANRVAKRAAERRLKKPVWYSVIVDVDTAPFDTQKLLSLIGQLTIHPQARKHANEMLGPYIGEFGGRFVYMLRLYQAQAAVMKKLQPSRRGAQAYAKRLKKYVELTGTLPESQHVPPVVANACARGESAAAAVRAYLEGMSAAVGEPGQPPLPDRDRLVLDTYALISSYGVRRNVARQYTDLLLGACGIADAPKIGDRDGHALRVIQNRLRIPTRAQREVASKARQAREEAAREKGVRLANMTAALHIPEQR